MKSTLTIIIAVALSLIAGSFLFNKDGDNSNNAETAYERVMRTQTIRCGYFPSPIFLDINPNNSQMSGIVFDYMTQMTKNLGLKLEWVEEVGVADYISGLKADRFDIYCTALTMNGERARSGADFTDSYISDRFDIYVRHDDKQFDFNLASLNSADVRFVALEGDIFGKIVRKFFPKATLTELSQLSSQTDPLLYVQTKKADVVISTPLISQRFIDNNPNQIRRVQLNKPFIYANTALSIKSNEYALRRMMDIATLEMQANGQLDTILDKYDPNKMLGRRTLPFTTGDNK